MTKYEVLTDFVDLQDGNYVYRAGEIYPRAGTTPDKARIQQLAGKKNALETEVIREIPEEKPVRKPRKKNAE